MDGSTPAPIALDAAKNTMLCGLHYSIILHWDAVWRPYSIVCLAGGRVSYVSAEHTMLCGHHYSPILHWGPLIIDGTIPAI